MIAVRRSDCRRRSRRRGRTTWHTFASAERDEFLARGFYAVESFAEHHLRPEATIPTGPRSSAEVVIYVREGTLAVESRAGPPGVILPGEFQHTTTTNDLLLSSSPLQEERAQVFQIRLRTNAPPPIPTGPDRRRFSAAERRGVLCVVASSDGRNGSLRLQRSAEIYSSLLDTGQHLVHDLPTGRVAWLHLIVGKLSIGGLVLTPGDGVGFVAERAVSFTASEPSEVLLLDMDEIRAPTVPTESAGTRPKPPRVRRDNGTRATGRTRLGAATI